MYVIVAGGGKVGANVARSLLAHGARGDADRAAPRPLRAARGGVRAPGACSATRRSCTCSSGPGIARPPDLVLAVTGDDEDNLVICQLAREGYGVAEGDRARQRPAQPGALRPARHHADGLRDLEHARRSSSTRCPSTSSCTCSSCARRTSRSSRCRSTRRSPVRRQDGRRSCAARGRAPDLGACGTERRRSPIGATVLQPGDQVLAILEPGKEDELRTRAAEEVAACAGSSSLAALARRRACGRPAATTRRRAPAQARRKAARLVTVVRGLSSPVYVAAPPSEPGRLYVVEQGGTIRSSRAARCEPASSSTFATASCAGGEQGLLAVALHPRYGTNHRFYVDYTDRNGDTRVVEYRANAARRPRSGPARSGSSSSTSPTRTTTAAT